MARSDADFEPEYTVDIREIDGPPFDDIMAALNELESNERLRLIAPFEPQPLYGVLEQRGFSYESEEREPGLFFVHVEGV